MKWIKNRSRFLNEAKIRDIILPRQTKAFINTWGEKYLDYEEVDPTDKIEQGMWKLSEDDKLKVLAEFFQADMNEVFELFEGLPDKFVNILNDSINTDLIRDNKNKYEIILKDFNAKKPTIDQMTVFFDAIFRKLSVSETQSTEMIQKDENGRPIRDEEGNMIKVKKEAGAPIFEKNLVNINGFIEAYNRSYPGDAIAVNTFSDNGELGSVVNMAKENHNPDYKIDFEVFNRDIYLSIKHDPKQILNMSISRFFSSCQHLYTGGYRRQIIGNVFDPNSIPAFLVFDTPIFWGDEKISDNLPLSRMMIRNIETFDNNEKQIYFDRCYPDRMEDILSEMIEKYTSNKSNVDDVEGKKYLFTPDINVGDDIDFPYMDRFDDIRQVPYIGRNTKSIHLDRNIDWSNVKISPNAKIKEIVIETTKIPGDLLKMNFNPDWIKFKYIKINDLTNFDNIKTSSVAFDKCKFKSNVIDSILKINPDMEKLQFISCDISGDLDLSPLDKLEELQLVYTLDDIDSLKIIMSKAIDKLKKLVISSDLVVDKESKSYISELKRKIKVEILGPNI